MYRPIFFSDGTNQKRIWYVVILNTTTKQSHVNILNINISDTPNKLQNKTGLNDSTFDNINSKVDFSLLETDGRKSILNIVLKRINYPLAFRFRSANLKIP